MTNWYGPTAAAHALPSDPRLRRWLQAEGSLTARLRRHGLVEVRVQQQGTSPLWAAERADLRMPSGYVREVVLLVDGRPAVWARSATTLTAVQGPWRALRGLGTRPLAELLFAQRHVQRDPLQSQQVGRGSPHAGHISRQWLALQQTADAAVPRWARSSVFWRHDQPLRVMEVFSPWVARLASV